MAVCREMKHRPWGPLIHAPPMRTGRSRMHKNGVPLELQSSRKVGSSRVPADFLLYLHDHAGRHRQVGLAPALAAVGQPWKEAGCSGTCHRGGTARQTLVLPKMACCNVSSPLS